MKDQNLFQKLGNMLLGKGFYIVLFLCVATIGMSGYYLFQTFTDQPALPQPVGGDASVILPDSEANGPDPQGTVPEEGEKAPHRTYAPERVQSQPDDPEPVAQPSRETAAVSQPAARVFAWPVKGELIRDFSLAVLALDPTMGDWRTHNGLDIGASLGTKVLAIAAGTVAEIYEDGLMGTTVVVDHGEGLTSTYCNLASQATVEPGDNVETGTVLGAVGDSTIGESGLTAHLHLEVSKNGQAVDPMDYLPERN